MTILSGDDIIAGRQPKQIYSKGSVTTKGAGTFHSLWKVPGNPGAGNNPPLFSAGAGYVPNLNTPGAVQFTPPAGSEENVLANFAIAGSVGGFLYMCDRVWACSGLSANVTTTQSIVTPSDAARYLNFDGNELYGEIYAAPGATGSVWTVSYTNSDNVSGRTATYTHPASAEVVGQLVPFTLQAGDRGVRSVQSFACSVATGVVGDIGLTIVRQLVAVPLQTNGFLADGLTLGLPRVANLACITGYIMCSAATSGLISGNFGLAQK